ncbi:MAG TPA: VWD domain-containing protein [Iamia sp.]
MSTVLPPALDPQVEASRRCIAERLWQTRGYVRPTCVDEPKALERYAEYEPAECKGDFDINQIEAIAQARAIARLNKREGGPLPGHGVLPSVQWEMPYQRSQANAGARSGGRPDITYYDPLNPTGVIELVELKMASAGGGPAAARDMAAYTADLPGGARPVLPYDFQSRYFDDGYGYNDAFVVPVRECDDMYPVGLIDLYEVASDPLFPGALVVANPQRMEFDCEDEPNDPSDWDRWRTPRSEDEDEDGEDDFWERMRELFPEYPWPTILPGPPEEQPGEIPVLVLVAIGALLLGTCLYFLAACLSLLGLEALASSAIALPLILALLDIDIFDFAIWGDPHIATPDGFAYDLQAVGEFHLLEVPSLGMDVQARFVPQGEDVSRLGAVSTRIAGRTIELGDGGLVLDGEPTPPPANGILDLGDGAVALHGDGRWIVMWPGQTDRPMMYQQAGSVGFHLPEGTTDARGLLGNVNGDPLDDLAYPDGTPLPATTSAETIHGPYADAWRITDEESSFTYGPSESTETHTDLSFPENLVTIADLTEAEVAASSAVCADANVLPGPQFEACVLDIALTGDEQYAEDAALVTEVLVDGTEHPFDATGALAEDFEGAIAPNLAGPRHTDDPATTKVAGPLFDTPGYRLYARDVPRHGAVEVETDLLTYGPVGSDAHKQSVAVRLGTETVGSVDFDGTEPVLTGGLTGTVERTGVGTTTGGQPFTRYHLSTTLPHGSSALDIELVPRHFRGVLGTALAVDDIALQLVVPEAQPFTASLPIVVPSSAHPTGAGAGVLEEAGAQDEYTFELATGQRLLLDHHSCDAGTSTVLVDVATSERTTLSRAGCDDLVTDPLPAGEHRLEVWGEAAGSYSFTLSTLPPPQAFPIAIGDTVSDGVPAAGAGNIETIASVDRYEVTVPTGGATLQYQVLGYPRAFTVTDGDDEVVATGFGNQRLELDAGDHTIEFSGAVGTYSFQLFEVPDPQTFAYVIGDTVSDGVPAAGAGNLETIASVDHYDFTVPSGGMDLQYEVLGYPKTFTITDDADEVVATGYGNQRLELEAGDYQIELRDQPGPYSFRMFEVPLPQTFPYSIGDTVSDGVPAAGAGNLETIASVDRYEFTVPTGGMTVQYEVLGYPKAWVIVDDADEVVADGQGNAQLELDAGDHRIVFRGHGTYSFRMFEVPAPQTFSYSIGDTVSDGVPAAGAGNLETIASVDRYDFTVPSGGQTVEFENLGYPKPTTLLDRTTGDPVPVSGSRWALPAGDYRLVVADDVGTYSFRLYVVPGPQIFDYVIGDTVSNGVPAAGAGNLETGASTDSYRFTVPAGGMALRFQHLGYWKPFAIVDRSTGLAVSASSGSRWDLPAGEYSIDVTGPAGDYSFVFFEIPAPQEFDYELGDVVSDGVPEAGAGNLETIESIDRYDFTIPVGGMDVRFEHLGYPKAFTIIDRATGSAMSQSSNLRWDLPEGDYRLQVTGSGTYSFILYEVPGAQEFAYEVGDTVSNGVPAAGAGNLETVVSVDRYDFTVPVGGMDVRFEHLGYPKPFTIIDLATGLPVSQSSNLRWDLPEGDYRLEVKDSVGEYSFRLYEVPAPQQFSYAIGDTVSNGVPAAGAGNLETIVSVDRYDFSVPTGGMDVQHVTLGYWKPFSIIDLATGTPVAPTSGALWSLPAGAYRIEYGGSTGEYSFRLEEVP